MLTDEQLDQITQAVARGHLSEEEGLRLAREAVSTGVLEGLKPKPPAKDPRKALPVTTTDRELLVDALVSNGATRTAALEASLVTDPATKVEMIEGERRRQQARADAQAAMRYEATPQGKLERGERLAAERTEAQRLVAPAEELLREQGLTDADVAALSVDEKLVMAGLREASIPQRESHSRMVSEGLQTTASMAAAEIAASSQRDRREGQ